MTRHRSAALLVLAALFIMFVAEAQGASDVAKVDKVGWWSKRPGAQPTTGDLSFEVASGPDGNESVAAIRILIQGTITKATLVLSEAANQTTAVSVPKIEVCRTNTPWDLTKNPGPYDAAPKPDCAQPVALKRDDKGSWTGDITSMVTGAYSERSVMVVPAEDKSLPVPPTFFLQFATSRVEADGTLDVTPTTETPATAAAPPVSGGSSSTPRPTVAAPPAASRVTTPPPATAAPTPTTAAATRTESQSIPTRLGGSAVRTASKKKDWGQLSWIVPLSALLAFVWTVVRRTLLDRDLIAST